MALQLLDPVSVKDRDFQPRIVGQTTLFPLNEDLQAVMKETYNLAVQLKATAYIHDWRKSTDVQLRTWAHSIVTAFKSTLRPYIEGLPLKEGSGMPGLFAPPLMSYEAQHKDIRYSISFRISDNSTYLIASPELECRLQDSSRIKPALEGIDPNKIYERILDYVFRRKELDRDIVDNVEVVPWGYSFALKPVLVDDIHPASREFSDAAKKLEDQSEVIHQAALLLSLVQEGGERARKLEQRLGARATSRIVEPERRMEQEVYRRAQAFLDTVPMIKTPTLDTYFV